MKIDSYAVNASAQRTYQRFESQTVQLRLGGSDSAAGDEKAAVRMSLSQAAQQLVDAHGEKMRQLGEQMSRAAGGTTGVSDSRFTPKTKEELKLQMLDDMLHAMTGKRMNPRIMDLAAMRNGRFGGQPLRIGGQNGFSGGIELRTESIQYEYEAVSYNAQGIINTADGKTLSVDVSMSMSREFFSYASTSMQLRPPGNLVDPLVINYGGTAASLTNEKYAFDLTMDGVAEQISFAGPGSGFLALDKNGDGVINDGGELFGPSTGSGFSELRDYDSDGNGWIDENDDVFSKLRIWSKDANGKDQLYTLLDLDIGAIYLGDVSTRFGMYDAAGNSQGNMQSTSFFLKESGGAGTISHIDLLV